MIRRRGPKSKKTPEGYARFAEATRLFEPLSTNTFNYRVRAGDIVVKEDEGGKMYETASILSTKEALQKEEEKKKTPIPMIHDWIGIDDVYAGLTLDHIVYHEIYLANAAHYEERKKKNPYTSIGIFDASDRGIMYAYISLLPMKEETIMDILLGRRPETEITSKDILTYDEPGDYTLLVSSIVHHPDHSRRILVRKLLNAYMDFWVENYPEKRIKRIYAETVTEDGIRMANELRMGPIYKEVDGSLERIKDAYVLDMEEPAASRIIRHFQERLKEKSQRPQ